MDYLHSVSIRDNKLISFYFDEVTGKHKARIYELKDGSLLDISNNGRVFDLDYFHQDFELKIFDALDDLQEEKNKLWLRFVPLGGIYDNSTLPFINHVGYIDLTDMSLKNSTSFKFPTDGKFPISKYTVNKITNELGSALYITGGYVHSEKDDTYSATNSFYKYNFTSKEWVDMAYSVNGKLKPMIEHKAIVIDNRYLVILGGRRPIFYEKSIIIDETLLINEYYSMYNLTVFDTFTNSWENINIKPDMFDTIKATIQFDSSLATVYNNKILALGGYVGKNGSSTGTPNSYLGILDFKSKNWAWTPMLNEDGSNYSSLIIHKDLLLFNDQLILFSGELYLLSLDFSNFLDYIREDKEIPFKVYDMLSQRMKSTLRLTNSSNTKDSEKDSNETKDQHKALPTYAIALIALSCTVTSLSLIYLLYRKNKSNSSSDNGKIKYNGPIREVWANQDIDNALNIITRDNTKGLVIKENNPNGINSNSLNSNTDNSYKLSIIEFNKQL